VGDRVAQLVAAWLWSENEKMNGKGRENEEMEKE